MDAISELVRSLQIPENFKGLSLIVGSMRKAAKDILRFQDVLAKTHRQT